MDGIDIDFPTTSLRDEIPSHECYVANQEEISQSKDKEQVENKDTVESTSESTAPIEEAQTSIKCN